MAIYFIRPPNANKQQFEKLPKMAADYTYYNPYYYPPYSPNYSPTSVPNYTPNTQPNYQPNTGWPNNRPTLPDPTP